MIHHCLQQFHVDGLFGEAVAGIHFVGGFIFRVDLKLDSIKVVLLFDFFHFLKEQVPDAHPAVCFVHGHAVDEHDISGDVGGRFDVPEHQLEDADRGAVRFGDIEGVSLDDLPEYGFGQQVVVWLVDIRPPCDVHGLHLKENAAHRRVIFDLRIADDKSWFCAHKNVLSGDSNLLEDGALVADIPVITEISAKGFGLRPDQPGVHDGGKIVVGFAQVGEKVLIAVRLGVLGDGAPDEVEAEALGAVVGIDFDLPAVHPFALGLMCGLHFIEVPVDPLKQLVGPLLFVAVHQTA